MSFLARLNKRWVPIDWIVVAYTIWMGLLIAWHSAHVPEWPRLVAIHAGIVVALVMIPPRGASWERREWPHLWQAIPFQFVRFVRYAYPLALALFFFEEGQFTVNMIFPETPYWFEPYLFAGDEAVFGELPIYLTDAWVTPWFTEVMNFFYFMYYIIMIGGIALAYVGYPRRRGNFDVPATGFHEAITSLGLAFILAFLCYPWLASRGPWETPELMAELTPMTGWVFTSIMENIIAHGAVSGNCFPSGHVAGAWATVFGLAWTYDHRRVVYVGAFLSAGMTLSCVYLRYHHALDMPAGFACAMIGAVVGGWLVRRFQTGEEPVAA